MAVYLNTYEVWQAYGGPEEGGWWFDCGQPVQSVLISHDDYDEWLEGSDPEERRQMADHATMMYTKGQPPTPSKTGYGGYTFAPGGEEPLTFQQDNDFKSYFEESFAEPFPKERPFYC